MIVDLLAWLASLAPDARDAAVEKHLGIDVQVSSASPGEHLVGYHASGVAPIVHALLEVPVTSEDVLFDIGAGLGKVLLLARLLTGATTRGVELQSAMADHARAAARRLALDIEVTVSDARDADLFSGTVFFLYLPFTGPVLLEILDRLRAVADQRAIVVCTLGLDLEPHAPWLVRREIDSFWLAIYDSAIDGVPARARSTPSSLLRRAATLAVAYEAPRDP